MAIVVKDVTGVKEHKSATNPHGIKEPVYANNAETQNDNIDNKSVTPKGLMSVIEQIPTPVYSNDEENRNGTINNKAVTPQGLYEMYGQLNNWSPADLAAIRSGAANRYARGDAVKAFVEEKMEGSWNDYSGWESSAGLGGNGDVRCSILVNNDYDSYRDIVALGPGSTRLIASAIHYDREYSKKERANSDGSLKNITTRYEENQVAFLHDTYILIRSASMSRTSSGGGASTATFARIDFLDHIAALNTKPSKSFQQCRAELQALHVAGKLKLRIKNPGYHHTRYSSVLLKASIDIPTTWWFTGSSTNASLNGYTQTADRDMTYSRSTGLIYAALPKNAKSFEEAVKSTLTMGQTSTVVDLEIIYPDENDKVLTGYRLINIGAYSY